MSKKAPGELLRDQRALWFGSEVEELDKRKAKPRRVTLALPVLLNASFSRFQGILQSSSNAVGVVAFTCDRSPVRVSLIRQSGECPVPFEFIGCDRLLDGVTDSC
jgi:hypothetical protein